MLATTTTEAYVAGIAVGLSVAAIIFTALNMFLRR